MAGEKLSPRQQMIGMMYLVLTAMLAMNISKEVLNGFVKVNDKLGQSNKTISGQANALATTFESKYATNKEKVGPFYNKAKEVSEKADEMIQYVKEMQAFGMAASTGKIETWKEELIAKSDDLGVDTVLSIEYIDKKDEYQALTQHIFGHDPNNPKPADENDPYTAADLKMKLESFRDFMKAIKVTTFNGLPWEPSKGFVNGIDKAFQYEDGEENGVPTKWEAMQFYDVPLAAVIAYLSSIQLDIENAKANALTELLGGVEGKDYKFTNLVPLVIPQSNYVLRGDTFRADVLLAAYDASNPPQIFIDQNEWNGTDSTMMQLAEGAEPIGIGMDGLGKLRIPTNSLSISDHQYKGLIKYRGPSGEIEDWPFFVNTFKVAEASIVVEPTAMNVFYRGIDNPVTIAVPGVASDAVTASCPGHSLRPGAKKGEWVIKPGSGQTANITVSAKMPDGSNKSFPSKEFRVKPIPDPEPRFGGKTPTDVAIKRDDFVITPGIRADMKNFEFDVSVTIKSFTMVFIRGGQYIERKSSSNKVTSDMKAMMDQVKRGEKVYIEDIMVTLPDGTTRKLANMALKIT
ncbi:MAG: gliding motility protein GldM [Flavobacteriales bacterium]|nr:gliding motility protein GldM [Flavobacteriales bacterium]